MRTAKLGVIVVLAVGACEGAEMSHELELARSAAHEGRAETDAYVAAARMLPTLPALARETSRHLDAMVAIDGDLGDTMTALLFHCRGGGMDDMPMIHAQLGDELTLHRITMRDAGDLVIARAELDRHGGAVDAMMDDLDVAIDRMSCSR